ncbi:KOW motif-containing protein [Candidatus Pacearchaeota archaeon]|nr:KOW motif-containing protein [Candidatus Pacearchaeota archaeon]
MHQTRKEVIWKIPIERKGNKYVARALSNIPESIPVVIAIRDVLKLAKTAKEVKAMIHNKLLKLNGRFVRDINESINLFNIIEADKKYVLFLLPTGRFTFKETKDNERLCKVISRTLLPKGKIQLNMHDGTNVIGSKDIKVGDSVYLDFSGKIKSHVSFGKGKSCIVMSGKYEGLSGKITSIKDSKALIKLNDEESELPISSVIVL